MTLTQKERLAIPQQKMMSQDPAERIRNTSEVAIGYTDEMARTEAMRCLQCPTKPCVNGCPVSVDIPGFIKAIEDGELQTAVDIIKRTNLLPRICGRVCPQEVQCMKFCTVGKINKDVEKSVSIGCLERYVSDLECKLGNTKPPAVKPNTGKKIAVVGSGPAGITFAVDVRREGHDVTIFEALHKPGGVLTYGIPEFRLPKSIVENEINCLRQMGIHINTDFLVGRSRSVKSLLEDDGFSAVFVGSGAGLPKFMNIAGENLVGVFSANEYLTRANLMKAYNTERANTPILRAKRVAVLGGGNVAMDTARTALRLGAEKVFLIYRRTEAEMPARIEEVAHAKEEGVEFLLLQNAVKILGDSNDIVTGIECIRYELGEPDASGRRSPVPISGSNFTIDVDSVIVAIGNDSNPLIPSVTPEIKVNKQGHIVVDENNETSMRNVFAGGDIVLGTATVILAMGEGRRAAAVVNERLRNGCK